MCTSMCLSVSAIESLNLRKRESKQVREREEERNEGGDEGEWGR